MAHYIQFTDEHGSTILVETSDHEVKNEAGVVKAGLTDLPQKAVVSATTVFEKAVQGVVQQSARAFLQAVRNLPPQDQPESMAVEFGLKATGEFGNAAIAQGGAEANFSITMTWKRG